MSANQEAQSAKTADMRGRLFADAETLGNWLAADGRNHYAGVVDRLIRGASSVPEAEVRGTHPREDT